MALNSECVAIGECGKCIDVEFFFLSKVINICLLFLNRINVFFCLLSNNFYKQGLDYNRDFSPRDIQREVFMKQIQIAIDLKRQGINLPLFLHERDAHEDFVNILDQYKDCLPNIVVHCFTGSQQEALKYLDMGFYLGITGYISKMKPENGLMQLFQEKKIPLDRLSKYLFVFVCVYFENVWN